VVGFSNYIAAGLEAPVAALEAPVGALDAQIISLNSSSSPIRMELTYRY
jgi:hypothetical protein